VCVLLLDLQTQASTAFGAASANHSATTFGFHTNEKTVGTSATDFGRLIGTFHNTLLEKGGFKIDPFERRFSDSNLFCV
jgi:hypothetical protein